MINVTLAGGFVGTDGYAVQARRFVKATMKDVDWNIMGVFQHAPESQFPELIDKRRTRELTISHNPVPFAFKNTILYTVWETSKVHNEFNQHANRCQELWCPTPFVASTFDVDIPKKVVPFGFDYDDFHPVGPTEAHPFRFLFVGQWNARKSPIEIIEAFSEEFDADENVELWVKRSYLSNSEFPPMQTVLRDFEPKIPIVDVKIHYEDMQTLYHQCDCLVSPSRGEGYGLTAVEAGLCGLDVIVTDWSALHDIWGKTSAHLVKYDLRKVGNEMQSEGSVSWWFDPESRWAVPNVDSLMKEMRSSYENPLDHRQELFDMNMPRGKALFKAIKEVSK